MWQIAPRVRLVRCAFEFIRGIARLFPVQRAFPLGGKKFESGTRRWNFFLFFFFFFFLCTLTTQS